MEYSPPPLFKQGPSAFARLIVFVALALGLLISDARYRTLETLRQVIGTGLYPLQRVALAPRDLVRGISGFFVTLTTLRAENQELKTRNLKLALQALQAVQLGSENAHLRALLQFEPRETVGTVLAEIQYDAHDPFTQKVVIDRGLRQGVQAGAPVVNEEGVIGQVTRVYPLQAEVTLLTDKDQAVPVQLVRTGVRSIISGTPRGDLLELRYIPVSADIQVDDQLVTSGLDGVFPPGLPVAKVLRVERQEGAEFVRVICVPYTPVRGTRQLLVLHYENPPPLELNDAAKNTLNAAGNNAGAKAKATASATPTNSVQRKNIKPKTSAKSQSAPAPDTTNQGPQ
ncbi:rod shape-determining protein MreC [Mycoavidus sp. SF9855]|uniref:rod shape-determining protein MreC n=1 Tax=Mycoavidus sp. SF9855 TaxID=2968475 RepID=UPI00211C4AEC|nr:rod shape-determining protein MreC [Mycoavidus sp. SF9855]UUM21523.1 rod shape-determining protein MreC [Mycoavidus sp. SF9855]